jgi:prolyl 4-hydroxylase
VIDGFLTRAECGAIIESAERAGLRRSQVMATGDDAVSPGRTSTQTFLSNVDPAAVVLIEKVERLVGVPRTMFEQVQVIRYDGTNGEKYDAHYDACYGCDRNGLDVPRLYTVLVYLACDECEGGATAFPNLDVSVDPVAGRAVVWKNLDENGVAKWSFHAGTPVTKGVKWAANVWVRTVDYKRK